MKRSSWLSAALAIAASLAMGADQSALAQQSGKQQTAVVQTIPPLAGVHINPNGVTELRTRLIKVASGTTARFDRLYATGSGLTAAFDIYHRVRFRFADPRGKPVDPKRIVSVTLRSGMGITRRVTGRDPVWLLAERAVPLESGLSQKSVEWSVQSVMVDGSNVVNRGQQRFVPGKQREVSISVLFFQATFSVRDTLFGFPLGSAIRLRFPDGRVRRYPLDNGASLRLPSLPRGQYEVSVDAPGFSFTQPVSVSRDQRDALSVTSYLDVALLGGAIGSILLGLLLVRRPWLRSAIRDRLTRPTGAITVLEDRGTGAEAAPQQALDHLNGHVPQPVNETRAITETASGSEPPGEQDEKPRVSTPLGGARHDLNQVVRTARQTAAEGERLREALVRRRGELEAWQERHSEKGKQPTEPTGEGEGRRSAIAGGDHGELAKSAREWIDEARLIADRLRQVADQKADKNGGR